MLMYVHVLASRRTPSRRAGSLGRCRQSGCQQLKRELSLVDHGCESRLSSETGDHAEAITSNLWPEFSPRQASLCTCLSTLMSQNRN